MSDPATACACGTCATCAGGTAAALTAPDRAFAFRHSQIRGRMLDAIAGVDIDGLRPLAALGGRSLDDPAMALVDAQAACLHVLAWNTQRLADDATIARSEDRDAMAALARLLGYEPRPALGATTTLAFTLDDFPGSPGTATIPAGTKVASMPRQNELPQTFETDVAIEARAAWNALEPVQAYGPDSIDAAAGAVWVAGTTLVVRAGDHLFFMAGGAGRLAIVTGFERVAEAGRERTRIDYTVLTKVDISVHVYKPDADLVVVLGQRAAPFGATAPDARLMPKGCGATINASDGTPTAWKDFVVGAPDDDSGDLVDLDAVYGDAVAGRWVVFTKPGQADAGTIIASREQARADFGMSAKVTQVALAGIPLRIELDNGHTTPPIHALSLVHSGGEPKSGGFDVTKYYEANVRETAIYLETGRARLFRFVTDRALPGDLSALDVAGTHDIPAGRRVMLSGETWSAPGVGGALRTEVAEVARAEAMNGFTRLHFRAPLSAPFRAEALRVNANCAPASHGETIAGGPEIVGSGNAAARMARYGLARGPLAYLPADTPRGYAPALEMRVDGRRYDEVPMLYGQAADARTYVVRQVAGRSEVQFAGTLPGGTYNVTALYRVGGGTAGLLDAGRLTSLLTPVLGVKSATNPLATSGGSDEAGIDELRVAAPHTVRTLDRVVSLADYEAFASDYRGIGKAMAGELHDGMRVIVVLTVADTALKSPAAGSDTVQGLVDALARYAVPGRKVRVQGFTGYCAPMTLRLAIDPALVRTTVEGAVRDALAAAFGPAARRFGQALHASQVLATVQEVPGVRAAQLASWARALADPFTVQSGAGEGTARLACPGLGLNQQAGLLWIDPARITLTEMPA